MGFADSLGFKETTVAGGEAYRWHDGVVTLCNVGDGSGFHGGSGGWEVCQCSLGFVKACSEGCEDATSLYCHVGYNDIFGENRVVETKSSRIQIEVSAWRWRIISGISRWPDNICEWRCGNAVLSWAKITWSWRIGVDCTAGWFGNVTDISR